MTKLMQLPFKIFIISSAIVLGSCTFETRNKISRSIQNWTGTNGVVDVFSNGKVMYRFLNVEKLTTAEATDAEASGASVSPRPYRFGYGVLDLNYNFKVDMGETKVYFEVSNHSSPYMFYENPFPNGSAEKWPPSN
jgi:hypothetical protein